MRHGIVLLLLCGELLAGCSTAPATHPAPDALLHDAVFEPTDTPVDQDIFATSEAMRTVLRTEMAALLRSRGLRLGLAESLQKSGRLKLAYDATVTRNASQTFEAGAGNCLSLVIMTAAFARELGLQVQFQTVESDDVWRRHAGLYVVSGHVNLTLGRRGLGEAPGYDAARQLTIDFLPAQDIRGQRVRPLAERTVVAMFMNNRAAESMALQQLNQAYAWARAAVRQDPNFLAGYNTLAVVYLRHGDVAAAEQVLRHVLAREPTHAQALANLVQAVRAQGRHAEADSLAQTLARIEPVAPFRDFKLGLAALNAGDVLAARTLFGKQLARDPDDHESHFWMAMAELRLGRVDEAQAHLSTAWAQSTTQSDRALYAAKLDRLGAALRPH